LGANFARARFGPSRPAAFFSAAKLWLCEIETLDKQLQACPNSRMDKASLIAKRRPWERPPARKTRLELERKLMRPRMRVMILRLPGKMIAALDNERRLYPKIPARNAMVRELLDEAMAFRRSMRPRGSGSGRGEPFPIDLDI
jgi:hypothetical protein